MRLFIIILLLFLVLFMWCSLKVASNVDDIIENNENN